MVDAVGVFDACGLEDGGAKALEFLCCSGEGLFEGGALYVLVSCGFGRWWRCL